MPAANTGLKSKVASEYKISINYPKQLLESPLEYILTHSYKAEMISYLKAHPEAFNEAIKLALSDKQPYSWRAAWLLWSCMDYNDLRLQRYQKKIIGTLPITGDNQLRELLLILQRMELKVSYTGKLFDICVKVWEKTDKQPSVRINAFKLMVKIAKKYPDLTDEIIYLTQFHYLYSLSAAVKKSVFKLTEELKSNRVKN
jgi:hypothetical protein